MQEEQEKYDFPKEDSVFSYSLSYQAKGESLNYEVLK
jgi:hypothetical protein